MIIEKISDSHPHGKLMLQPVEATWSKYPQRLCFSVNKPNIEM